MALSVAEWGIIWYDFWAAPVAQWIECRSPEPKTRGHCFCAIPVEITDIPETIIVSDLDLFRSLKVYLDLLWTLYGHQAKQSICFV